MKPCIFTHRAGRDLVQLWFKIARDNAKIADKFEAAVFKNCELLGKLEDVGHTRPDLTTKAVLVWPALPYRNYWIVYRLFPDSISILRIVHARRRRVWKVGI